jgi:glycosyltransferase involved in cell wall biosynthesis
MLYDYSLSYDDNERMPLAGTQTAFIELAKAFASIGAKVTVLTSSKVVFKSDNLYWGNLDDKLEDIQYDLLIVNISPWLFEKYKHIQCRKKILWIHNESKYLLFSKRYKYLLKYWPTIVFSGKYHKSTFPWFIPCGKKVIIPYGLSSSLLEIAIYNSNTTYFQNKKVFFTSNPLRSLRWIIDIWVTQIYHQVPDAELHIFSSWKTYGSWGDKIKDKMMKEINYANQYRDMNVFVREPLPKEELFKEMKEGRAMFYRGDKSETFCLAVAEAQALGLPAIVCNLGSMSERVIDGVTGYVVENNQTEFAKKAILLLTDDDLSLKFRKSAIQYNSVYTWLNVANNFLKLLD